MGRLRKYILVGLLLASFASLAAQDCRCRYDVNLSVRTSHPADTSARPGHSVWWYPDSLRMEGWIWNRYELDEPIRVDSVDVLTFRYWRSQPGGVHAVTLDLLDCAGATAAPIIISGPEANLPDPDPAGWRTYRVRMVDAGYRPGWVEAVTLISEDGRGEEWLQRGVAHFSRVALLTGKCAEGAVDSVVGRDDCTAPETFRIAKETLPYPNPTSGPVAGLSGPWRVYDAVGRLVLEGDAPAADLTGRAAGVYLIREESRAHRIVKY